ncbi:hypothetical protein [Arthrobacter sp. H-02-3]|uniref:hypothetical protein n=1 Tax=Arthrobacter sp. H-02-3 TaxID=2703675 RepID=UPI001F27140A|nr:hypothetical protein [Arthrobacter sp. H-02-3]
MNNKAIRLAAAGALTALLAGLAVPAQAATDPCSPLVDSVKICLAPDGRHYPVLVNSAVTVPGPTIGGALLVGNTLTAIDGPVDPWGAMLTHQWLRNDVPILGATGTTYTLTRSDLGKGIRVETTATAPDYAKTTVQSAKSAPVTAAAGAVPTIQILQVKVTTKSTTNFVMAEPLSLGPKGRLYLYQWLRDREPIPGATGKTFDTTAWAPPAALSVRVTAYAPGYDPATSTSTPAAVYPENATPGAIVAGGTGSGTS